jgi:hypothetical protein
VDVRFYLTDERGEGAEEGHLNESVDVRIIGEVARLRLEGVALLGRHPRQLERRRVLVVVGPAHDINLPVEQVLPHHQVAHARPRHYR